MKTYDVIIIGAGSAGLAARKEVAKVTENYLVIDQGPLGTTCARVGCMPSKALIAAANVFNDRTKFATVGINGGADLAIDGKALMNHVRKLRDHFVGGVLEGMEKWRQTHFLQASAKFISANTIEANGKQYQFTKAIVATGSTPTCPGPFKNVEGLLTTDSIFEIEDLPKTLAVVGLGAVGLELSQAFARLGVKVTAFTKGPSIGGLSSPELNALARKELAKEFEIIDSEIETATNGQNEFRLKVSGKLYEFDQVLLAAGRTPNLSPLELEKAGAQFEDKKPKYCTISLRVERTQIYFAGDVDALRAVLHEAVDQGRIAGFNSVQETDQSLGPRTALKIAYSHPNIAIIGKSRRELEKSSAQFHIGRASFENQGRAVLNLQNSGAIEIYCCAKGVILGAELFAPAGEHIAHLLCWAIQCDLNIFDVLGNPFYHPSIEEGIKPALQELARSVQGAAPDDAFRCDVGMMG